MSPDSIWSLLEEIINSLWELAFSTGIVTTTTTTSTTTTTASTTQTTTSLSTTSTTTTTKTTTVLTTTSTTVPSTTVSTTTTSTTKPTTTTVPLPRLQNATGQVNVFDLIAYHRSIDILINKHFSPGCGVRGGSEEGTKIVGGADADENEYPWQCSVLNKDNSVGDNG